MKSLIKNWQIFLQCRKDESSRKELFNLIWNQYQRRIIFFIRNMVKDNAEDLFQDVMLKVYRNFDKYNPLYSFNSWIYTIARNHCLNFMDKKRASIQGFEEDGQPTNIEESTPETEFINKELGKKIEKILNALNEESRQMAFLYFYEGLKNREIAQVMGIPTGTVKSRLHNIRACLKKDLENYYEN